MTDRPTDLARLAKAWREEKRAEDLARHNRVAIEAEIIAQIGCKEEGSQTHRAGDWKITITGKITRTLDRDAWTRVGPSIPEGLRPVQYVPKLDVKGLRYLRDHEPEIYRRVAEAVIAKPAKPAVTIT